MFFFCLCFGNCNRGMRQGLSENLDGKKEQAVEELNLYFCEIEIFARQDK